MEDASMTSNNVPEVETVEPSEAVPSKSVDDRLIDELVGGLRPRACG
jgi:putative transposase